MSMDRAGLAEFLRRRRESLLPRDVDLPPGQRRRTPGLRREEVASLCHMSTDYYSRLERERGPQPSEQMLAAIAHGLRLSLDERDHLFRLAGHNPPARPLENEVSRGLLRIFERLGDTPAEIVTELGETLRQTAPAVALLGDRTGFSGPCRSAGFRWFTDPAARELHDCEDHPMLTRMFVSGLRRVVTLRGPDSKAAYLANLLLESSDEFRQVWERHEIGVRPNHTKRFLHPLVGRLELTCQVLVDPDRSHSLLVYTALPGSESEEKLRRLSKSCSLAESDARPG